MVLILRYSIFSMLLKLASVANWYVHPLTRCWIWPMTKTNSTSDIDHTAETCSLLRQLVSFASWQDANWTFEFTNKPDTWLCHNNFMQLEAVFQCLAVQLDTANIIQEILPSGIWLIKLSAGDWIPEMMFVPSTRETMPTMGQDEQPLTTQVLHPTLLSRYFELIARVMHTTMY